MQERFENSRPAQRAPGSFWRWQWERRRAGLPKEPPEGYRLPVVAPELAFLHANRTEATVTWVGHSTVLLQIDGVNLLTDPQFSNRASPLPFVGPRRRVPPVPRAEELPHIDAVLISHNHYDHLDRGSVRALLRQAGGPPRFFVPCALRPWFARMDAHDVSEMNWWEERPFGPLAVDCVPAQHWSARSSFDRNRTLWSGWVIRGRTRRIFFAGDTGYSPDFAEIHRRFGDMDLAVLPIGHYEPRWFMQSAHVDPREALQIAQDLHARCAVAIHWGTFPLSDEPLDEPPRRLRAEMQAAGAAPERFLVLARGETARLDALPGAAV